MGWLLYILVTMINSKSAINKLIGDLEDSSPNLRNALKEISPISFLLSIKGHKNIYITIDGNNSDISFKDRSYAFEIKASLIDFMSLISSGKLNKNFIYGDAEVAIVLFNAVYKSNIDLIYLIDRYFGSLPAVFTHTIVNKTFGTSVVYTDEVNRKLRKRLRDVAIRLDRLEALKSI